MSQVIIVQSLDTIEKMKNHYKNYLKPTVPPGAIFAAKLPTCSITAYKSKKVLFQGGSYEKEASLWEENSSIKKQTISTSLPSDISHLSIIGTDEVGKGDFFGPLTVVAAYVKKEQIPLLKEIGVCDSKNLTDTKIIEIAKQIKEIIPFSLLILPNEKYNEIQQKGYTQGKITAILHNQAINHLLKKISPSKPEAILIDEFAKKEIYYNHLRNEKNIVKENVYFSTKAEGIHLAVAAASILARYAFIQKFDELAKKAGFPLTKGAGQKVDEQCARLIISKGEEVLPYFVKLHFANTEKAKRIVQRKNR